MRRLLFIINKHCKVKWKVKHQEEKKAVAEVVASEEAEVVTVVVEAEAAPVADQAVLPKMTGFPRQSLDVSSNTDTLLHSRKFTLTPSQSRRLPSLTN